MAVYCKAECRTSRSSAVPRIRILPNESSTDLELTSAKLSRRNSATSRHGNGRHAFFSRTTFYLFFRVYDARLLNKNNHVLALAFKQQRISIFGCLLSNIRRFVESFAINFFTCRPPLWSARPRFLHPRGSFARKPLRYFGAINVLCLFSSSIKLRVSKQNYEHFRFESAGFFLAFEKIAILIAPKI